MADPRRRHRAGGQRPDRPAAADVDNAARAREVRQRRGGAGVGAAPADQPATAEDAGRRRAPHAAAAR